MFKKCLLPMRMQPFHKGHKEMLEKALADYDQVFVLLGTDIEPREKNPFGYSERFDFFIKHSGLFELLHDRIHFRPGLTFPTDEEWIEYIEQLFEHFEISDFVCSEKENYEKWFDNSDIVVVKKYHIETEVSATAVRDNLEKLTNILTENPEFARLLNELEEKLPGNNKRYAFELITEMLKKRGGYYERNN